MTKQKTVRLVGRAFIFAVGMALFFPSHSGCFAAVAATGSVSPTEIDHFVPGEKNLSKQWVDGLSERGSRRLYRRRELDKIGMPIGGIGAGQLYLCGDGTLGCWEIFNRHEINYRWFNPDYTSDSYGGNHEIKKPVDQGFAVLYTSAGDRVVKRLNREDFPGVEFAGEYPIGTVRYLDMDIQTTPVVAEMEAFSPFIPLNAADSALPATLFHITLENIGDEDLEVAVAGWLENAVGINSAAQIPQVMRRNRMLTKKNRALAVFTAEGESIETLADYGSMVLAMEGSAMPSDEAVGWLEALEQIIGATESDTDVTYSMTQAKRNALLAPAVTLSAGEKKTFTFVFSWYFPNSQKGHQYANRFADAVEVADYILDNHARLAGQTRLWHDTYYQSTLPWWLLSRLHAPVANLATGTCYWWGNGRFWAYEGVGACGGTCTHVWNYAQAMGRLFPELERSVREMQDFGAGFESETGIVGYRGEEAYIAPGETGIAYAADGQCGTVLKAYREHQMSVDNRFLKSNWPRIRKVLEYSILQDGNRDGLIENAQHVTFDAALYGANPFVGSLYLAALRAGEEMALEMGDEEFAKQCRQIFESGRRLIVERLWNGEYFIQEVDAEKHPTHQFGDGCLSDQLFGQGWAHQVGLGYLLPENHVKTTLKSIWTYNWAPDVGPHSNAHKPLRYFAYPGDSGIFVCTWPKSKHPPDKEMWELYRNEVFTGTEYQVAGHMIWEGMVNEALTMLKGVDDRYQPLKHNPWNEVECGDHYARALASWGVFTALAGFEYHGPKGYLGFAPRVTPENFQSAFTAAEGWGRFTQNREGDTQRDRIEVRWGQLRLESLAFTLPEKMTSCEVIMIIAGQAVQHSFTLDNGRLKITLSAPLILKEGQAVDVTIKRTSGRTL